MRLSLSPFCAWILYYATSREVCSYRGCGSLLESIWHVEEPPLELSVEEEEIKNALHNDENAQLVLRAIERLDKRYVWQMRRKVSSAKP